MDIMVLAKDTRLGLRAHATSKIEKFTFKRRPNSKNVPSTTLYEQADMGRAEESLQQGICYIGYLDDIILWAENKEKCRKDILRVRCIIQSFRLL